MRETINKMWSTIKEYFLKLPMKSRIRLGILAAAVVILAIVVVAMLSRTVWVVLAPDPSGDIRAVLGGNGVRTRVAEEYLVEVPEGQLNLAQQLLYENGLVGTQTFSDFYMQQASGFGVSSEHAKFLYDSQTADRIRTQLLQNTRVANALVTVNSGETSPFRIQTNTRKATANIQVILNDGGILSQDEAEAIADMAKGSVPGLENENITITDQNFNSYKTGEEALRSANLQLQYDQRIALQNRLTEQLKTQVEQLLSDIFGLDNIRVQPSVRLNFDKTYIEMVEFDPPIPGNEEGILRSSEEIFRMQRTWADAMGVPGTDNNNLGTGGTPEYPWGELNENDRFFESIVTNNFEINETRTAIERAEGIIEELSIGIVINPTYMGADIEPPDYTYEVTDVVSKAIGVAARNVSVQYMEFSHIDTWYEDMLAAQAEREALERREKMIDRIMMYGTIILLTVMIILFVRSVIKALRPPPEPEMILAAEGPGGGLDLLISDEILEMEMEKEKEQGPEYEDIDLSVEKSAGLEQIERFIEKDPAAVAQLLRNWLSDE